ncbi:MAG: hydrolase, partial [Thiotrichaceae bacterium]|nr:hydrolase [Thiotrichaceae bacterium]
AGYNPVFMYFRGCSGRMNRLPRAYHSGDTGDIAAVVEHIKRKTGHYPYGLVSYSLGANAMLKWLGETGESNPIQKAVAVSVPFRLHDAGKRLEKGVSRIYRYHLLSSLRNTYAKKFKKLRSPLNVDIDSLKSFWSYDDQVTAPLHGFSGAKEYYDRSSSRQYLKNIKTPTRIIHASDNPFMFKATVPDKSELSSSIDFLLTKNGGHVGFISGETPYSAYSWCEKKIIEFLKQ